MLPEDYSRYEEFNPDGEYPYQDYYDTSRQRSRKRRRRSGFLALILIVLLVAGGGWFLTRFSVHVRQSPNGFSLSVQDKFSHTAETEAPAKPQPEDIEAIGKPPVVPVGSGTQLMLSETPQITSQAQAAGGLTLQQIYKKVIPSVVSITTTMREGGASGTGIIMSPDGYIITNDHVIDSAIAIEVLTSDDQVYAASLVGRDETSDLAVLKVTAQELIAAEFGDSERMEVGDAVVAIGDPLGRQLRGTMTDGIISAINRDLAVNGRSMTLMQTNAALNNGNSGGPLINAYGQVIGINTMKMSNYYSSNTVEGLGFAIPISTAKPLVDELIEKGFVSGRPVIGISDGSLPSAVRAYYNLPDGIYVGNVDVASDAYQKGIAAGDIITAIEGISVSRMEDFNAVKNQYLAGDTINLTVYRNGEYYSVDVVLMDAADF